MKYSELIPNREYIAIDKDGREYRGVYVNDYLPGGVFYCVYPAYTMDGKENDLVDFREIEEAAHV